MITYAWKFGVLLKDYCRRNGFLYIYVWHLTISNIIIIVAMSLFLSGSISEDMSPGV